MPGSTSRRARTGPLRMLRVLTRPHMLLLHLAAIVALVATILLGRWQYAAWQEHREDRTSELATSTPVPLASLIGPNDAFPEDAAGRPVEAAGVWLSEQSVYVADRPHDGATGFWLVTPLEVCQDVDCSAPSALAVVVGWTGSGEVPPSDLAPRGSAAVTAWIQPGEQDDTPDLDPEDAVLPSLRIAALVPSVDRDLYSAFGILRSPPAPETLTPVTPQNLPRPPASTALRNLLYAVQWWIFGGFAVFMWWRWCRDELDAAHPRTTVDSRIRSGA